jgi:hypothetical protein
MGIAKRTKPWPDNKPALLEVRPLTIDDIAELKNKRTETGRHNPLKELRDSHHLVARLIASGLRTHEVAEQSGFSITSVYRLNADPAFKELVAVYRREVDISHRETIDQFNALLIANRMKAERHLADRLDDDEVTIATRDLITISRDAADRTGFGKRSTQVHKHEGFATELESAWARSGKAKLIEGAVVTDVRPAPAAPPLAPAPVENQSSIEPATASRVAIRRGL